MPSKSYAREMAEQTVAAVLRGGADADFEAAAVQAEAVINEAIKHTRTECILAIQCERLDNSRSDSDVTAFQVGLSVAVRAIRALATPGTEET